MSKPVLGRGLGTLMKGALPGREAGAATPRSGVQLLLRGADGTELVPPVESGGGESTPSLFPSWALGATLVGDGVLLLVAFWVVLRHTGWGRFVAAGLLLMVGGGWLCIAVWLRGQRAVQELEAMNPLAEEKPRLRVRFLDEQPRPRH